MSILTPLIGLAVAALLGGWEWVVPCLIVVIALRRAPVADRVAAVAPGLLWLALFALTSDRRLYFCYSMQYAVHAACLRLPLGIGVAALFLAIRILQGASLSVLLVEVAVTVAVLAVTFVLHRGGKSTTARRLAISTLGSLLALAGLAL